MNMFKIITSVILLCSITQVEAQEIPWDAAALSWTAPTENTDGTPLTDLEGFTVYWGTSPGVYTTSYQITDPDATTHLVEDLSPGDWYFTSTAYNSMGVESEYANEATKTITEVIDPPVGFVVTDGIVYDVIKQPNEFRWVAVGTVPLDTPCISTQRVNDRYVVDTANVTWYGNVKPDVVVARCE